MSACQKYKSIIINQTKGKHETKGKKKKRKIKTTTTKIFFSCLVYLHIDKEVISHFYPEAFAFIWW